MADNVAITPGTGATVAADLIGGALYQRMKLALGADGTAVDAGAGSGASGTDTIRTILATDDPAVTILTALQKAEDAAHSSGDKGVMALSKRTDAAASSAGTDGDYATLNTDASGYLWTNEKNAALLVLAEDAASADGDKGVQVLTVRKNTAAATSGTDGDYQPLITDTNGRLHTIDVNGATIAALSKAEDAAHTTGDTGVPVLVRRKDAPAVSSGTDGDYSTLDISANGRAWVEDPHTVVSVTPVVSTTPAYTAGDAIGPKQTLTAAALISGMPTILDSLTIIDKSNQKPQLDILILDSDVAAATVTDNTALTLSTDVSKIVARIPVVTADWQTVGSDNYAFASFGALGKILKPSGTANLFVVVCARGTPTFVGTGDLTFKYGFKQK